MSVVCLTAAAVLLAIGLRRKVQRTTGRAIDWAFNIRGERVDTTVAFEAVRSQRG